MLPYGGSFLSPGDVALLHSALERALSSDTASASEILGAALLSAIMTTGRNLDSVASVKFGETVSQDARLHIAECAAQSSTWWFPPGRPTSSQLFGKMQEPVAAARPALIPLPCSKRTNELIRKLHHHGIVGCQVFPASHREANAALRHFILAAGVRCSLRRVEGWLFQRLVLAPRGDTGIAALITGHAAPITQTVVHYTALECDDIASHVADALQGFDEIPPSSNAVAIQDRIGSRLVPTLNETQVLADALSRPLDPPGRGKRRDPVAIHNAMTTYTIAMTQFATGCRPSLRWLPDDEAIDPATGFLIINDKPTRDNFKSRIVWVSDDCRDQLRLYRAHLIRLTERLPAIGPVTGGHGAPFYLSPDLVPQAVTRSALRAELAKQHWPYPLNAGRHFLRSSLAGKVSTETLHAMLGHWHLGTEAWGAASALDPVSYRDDLSAVLVPLSRRAGWLPRRGL